MVQGGDPESKNAPAERSLGQGGPGYTIEAEILYPKYFHKKGALAAARMGDQTNPQRRSSGSQFYLVQGNVYSQQEIAQIEQGVRQRQGQAIVNRYAEPHIEAFVRMQATNDTVGINRLRGEIMQAAAAELEALNAYRLPEQIREAYTTVGGTPHLDDAYTVFGEVIEGLDIIDKIAEVATNAQARPLQDVVMKIRVL